MFLKKVFFIIFSVNATVYAVKQVQFSQEYLDTLEERLRLEKESLPKSAQWLNLNYRAGVAYSMPNTCCYNWQKGLYYLKVAADGQYTPALVYLGTLYLEGMLLPQDITIGLKYILKAAYAGDVNACYMLGYTHYKGVYVEPNHAIALHWFTKAALKGNGNALYFLGRYAQLQNKNSTALSWYKQAAYQNHPEACYAYACLERAQGNYGIAQNYLKKAIELKYVPALGELGSLYVLGKGVPQDYEKAYELFCSGAQQGDEYACANKANLENTTARKVESFKALLQSCQNLQVKDYCVTSLELLSKLEHERNFHEQINCKKETLSKNEVDELCKLAQSLIACSDDSQKIKQGLDYYEYILEKALKHDQREILECLYAHLDMLAQTEIVARCYILTLAVRNYYPFIKDFQELVHYFDKTYKQSVKQNKCLLKIGFLGTLNTLVTSNNSQAACLLAYAYLRVGIYQDEEKATHFITRALELGSEDIVGILSYLVTQKIHLTSYSPRAVAALEELSNQGNMQARYILGVWYGYGDPDIAKALELLEQVTCQQKDNAGAHYHLAHALSKSLETIKDASIQALAAKKMVEHLKIAAKLNFSPALFELGNLLRKDFVVLGKVLVPSDPKAAFVYLQRAADEAGDVEALHLLGLMVYQGVGVSKDYLKAAELLKKSYEAGFDDALTPLALILFNKEHSVRLPYKNAFALFNYIKAIADDHTNKQYLLAASFVIKAYHEGYGVRKNTLEAVRYALATLTPAVFAEDGTIKVAKLAVVMRGLMQDLKRDNSFFTPEVKELASKLKTVYFERHVNYLQKTAQDSSNVRYCEALVGVTAAYLHGNGVDKDIKQAMRYAFKVIRDPEMKDKLVPESLDTFKDLVATIVQHLSVLSIQEHHEGESKQLLSLVLRVIRESSWSTVLISALVS